MYGAIIGDMVGSPYEFDQGRKVKEFGPLFINRSVFTDDSVMTIAVAEALMDVGPDAEEKEIKSAVVKSMQKWGRKYPDAGYGGRFIGWLAERDPKPYGSWGNGSAMRVSAAGWLYDSIERTREVAKWTAEVTHNHPEGVKGAEATASAIFLARNGSSKEEIKKYIIDEFEYDLSRTCDEIRPAYHHVESCQETVPEAITAFLVPSPYTPSTDAVSESNAKAKPSFRIFRPTYGDSSAASRRMPAMMFRGDVSPVPMALSPAERSYFFRV